MEVWNHFPNRVASSETCYTVRDADTNGFAVPPYGPPPAYAPFPGAVGAPGMGPPGLGKSYGITRAHDGC